MNFLQFISQWINDNPGKAAGALLGFIIGILIFSLGVLETFVILLLVGIGLFIGKIKDDNISPIDAIKKILRINK